MERRHLLVIVFIVSLIYCSKDDGIKPESAGAIKGKITDSADGKPIRDATILTEPFTVSVISDSLGEYELNDVEPGDYVILAGKHCYKTSQVSATLFSDELTICDISLMKSGFSESWDMSREYSTTNNPNGVWSYGRKWTPGDVQFDLMTVRWGNSGWYLGNWGHGGPSIQEGPNLWAKDNSNGLPVVRWTSPAEGYYYFNAKFTGVDSRGVDVLAYITVNDSIIFSHHIHGYHDFIEHSGDFLNLNPGDHIDFLIKWNGGVYSEYSWTIVNGKVHQYKGR